jgi:hypothetical protein
MAPGDLPLQPRLIVRGLRGGRLRVRGEHLLDEGDPAGVAECVCGPNQGDPVNGEAGQLIHFELWKYLSLLLVECLLEPERNEMRRAFFV